MQLHGRAKFGGWDERGGVAAEFVRYSSYRERTACGFADVDEMSSSEGLNSSTSRGNVGTAYSENRKGYAGNEWDTNERVYHVRHRVYLPENGRWTRRDPLGHVDVGLNENVGNSCIRRRDATGLRWSNIDFAIHFLISGIPVDLADIALLDD